MTMKVLLPSPKQNTGEEMALIKSRSFVLAGFLFVMFVIMTYSCFQRIDDVLAYVDRHFETQNSLSCELHDEPDNITWVDGLKLTHSGIVQTYTRPTKRLLLVAHYRGGSTYIGDIFARNPNFFYWYEPLLSYFQRMIDEYVTHGTKVISDHYYVTNNNMLR